ncbi:MAG: hypothetical protein Q8N54_13200 [Sulfurimicrobium sp.]|jgi:hypothetical protein|nr:hypothetical protein [Sulfurimicrobium sp.]MDO9189508.1 hypothetical protein [Sulfurimicrobium sp.]MDP1703561.1 hypothetical protein [Sulfurimicrobium sp.]MDP2200128.1 hypothetical protein [Sulfurimicrobium sp.]MDP2963709.1 hypothetical protein [Sulfurimicrobium sp.]
MAFLDELKKEAQALKEQEQNLTQARVLEVTQSFLLVQSKLKMILLYLQELVNNLNMLPQSTAKTYYIDGFGTIDDFRPEKYVVNTDRITINQKEFIKIIYLRFACKTDQEIVIEKNMPSMIEMQRQYLWQANLKFQCTEFKNEKGLLDRASFKVVNEIPVHIKFAADFEQARIFLSMKNFNGLTVNEFTYEADEVDENMLDEFAKYLIGKPSTFMDLGRHQQALRQKVAARRVNVEPSYAKLDPEHAAKLDAEADGSSPKERKKGFFGSLKSLLSKE